ncbi:MAG: methyltransferase domain-containing protein [Anaerolineae bacterium]|nr:methyltransferase domain-containing protein [Anaerolineae bacterium]
MADTDCQPPTTSHYFDGRSMEPSEYQTMYQVEERHWWYVGMQRITTTQIAALYRGQRDLSILDAGCGTGAVMKYLAPFGCVTGFDLMPHALNFCQERGLNRLAQASVTRVPFASDHFDLVTSFDVLCHRSIGDYRGALREFHRVLKPGGCLFLRLPAYNWLRGHHDEVVYTVHRFSRAEIKEALYETGFTAVKLSYANMLLFPLALGKRLAERLVPENGSVSDVRPNPPWQDSLFARFLYAEAGWLKHGPLPFGLTLMAIGRKV